MITARLFQRKDKKRLDETAPVFYVLAKDRKRLYIASGKYVHVDHFDNHARLVTKGARNSVKLNEYFRNRLVEIDNIINELTTSGQELTLEKVQQRFSSDNNGNDFISFAEKELEEQN